MCGLDISFNIPIHTLNKIHNVINLEVFLAENTVRQTDYLYNWPENTELLAPTKGCMMHVIKLIAVQL